MCEKVLVICALLRKKLHILGESGSESPGQTSLGRLAARHFPNRPAEKFAENCGFGEITDLFAEY